MILLTGASGFIGTHLRNVLANKFGRENILLFTSQMIEGFKCILHKDYELIDKVNGHNDLCDIDTVIHLGAFIPKSSIESNKWLDCTSNIFNTIRLIQLMPKSLEKFIFLSTIDVYESTDVAITEESIVNPSTLYAESKLYCEKMLSNWVKDRNVILQILRIGHIYGPGEGAYLKILPIAIKNVLAGISPIIYSNGNEKRSFLYVVDCCDYIINSINLPSHEGPINIVSSESISVLELIKKIIEISGSNIEPKILNEKVRTKDFTFDNRRLINLLGSASVSLEIGLREEIRYFNNLIND